MFKPAVPRPYARYATVFLTLTLYFVLRRGEPPELYTFPEYLEAGYTSRSGAILPGKEDRSREATVALGRRPATIGGAL